MSRLIMGIDPDLNGGIAVLSEYGQYRNGRAIKKGEFFPELCALIETYRFFDVYVERQIVIPGRGRGKHTQMINYGKILGFLECYNTLNPGVFGNRLYITEVHPRTWTAGLFNKEDKRANKIKSMEFAKAHMGDDDLSQGLADAFCVAYWGFENRGD